MNFILFIIPRRGSVVKSFFEKETHPSVHARTQSTRQKSGSSSGTIGAAQDPNSVVSFM